MITKFIFVIANDQLNSCPIIASWGTFLLKFGFTSVKNHSVSLIIRHYEQVIFCDRYCGRNGRLNNRWSKFILWLKFLTDWHSVEKFSERIFLVEKNTHDLIVTDEIRSDKYSDRVFDQLFGHKESKMWQKKPWKKISVEIFKNFVTNCDQLCVHHKFRSKKSMKFVKKILRSQFS